MPARPDDRRSARSAFLQSRSVAAANLRVIDERRLAACSIEVRCEFERVPMSRPIPLAIARFSPPIYLIGPGSGCRACRFGQACLYEHGGPLHAHAKPWAWHPNHVEAGRSRAVAELMLTLVRVLRALVPIATALVVSASAVAADPGKPAVEGKAWFIAPVPRLLTGPEQPL